ncbi:larval/pupal cuticle protein H1C-like [Uranotaenia lowii]|uniref:larval/pupal cuticle protein H1C-like n=1 Tax=Uranotaenia lowii TaxID=190385 RepID=UPI0024784063|nr:larval/pupal cuticle protein H1C-like [Uranotaenia lowii]
MAFKFVVFLASLAVASAGYLEAPVSYGAHYSPASAVSYSTISQAAPLAKSVAYAAPAVATYAHAAPAVATYSHAPAVATYAHAAPVHYSAPAHYSTPAIGATHESTIRSHDATVSHYSKAVDTPYSSVRKSDTRITNEAPKLALATTYAHAAPAVATYSHAPAVATYAHAPAVATYSHAPVVAKQVSYAAPAVATYAHAAPAVATYAHAPVVAKQVAYAAPVATYAHAAPAVATYAHAAPVVSAHATKTLTYSPAVEVAHVSYDGTHAHYGW